MATLDDVDEDEAFIMELMAMHPNDDDIIVEDLDLDIDEPPVTLPSIFIEPFDNGHVSDVRQLKTCVTSNRFVLDSFTLSTLVLSLIFHFYCQKFDFILSRLFFPIHKPLFCFFIFFIFKRFFPPFL
jgi:hypothetical protein